MKRFTLLCVLCSLLLIVGLAYGQGLTWKVANFTTAKFGAQGFDASAWGDARGGTVTRVTGKPAAGDAVLEVPIDFSKGGDMKAAFCADPLNIKGWDAGGANKYADTLSYRIWLPADFPQLPAGSVIQVFGQDRVKWQWESDLVDLANLKRGDWNLWTFNIKARIDAGRDMSNGLKTGIEFLAAAGVTWKGSIYVDEVVLRGVRRPESASTLKWVIADFQSAGLGLQNFENTGWSPAVKEVKRTTDKPAAGDAVMEVVVDLTAGDKVAIWRQGANPIGWNEQGKDKIADRASIDIWFPADFPQIAYLNVFGQDRTNWNWQQQDVDLATIKRGAWNTFYFDFPARVETVNGYDVSAGIQFGFQFGRAEGSTWSGSIYVDNATFLGVREPSAVFQSPAITSAAAFDTLRNQTTGEVIHYHKITWQDLEGDIGDTYRVYTSGSGPITDVKAAGVVLVSANIPRGTQQWNEILTTLDGRQVTRYYTVTTTRTDPGTGQLVETPIRDGISNTGPLTSKSNFAREIPFFDAFSQFVIDGDLGEFRTVAETFTRSKLVNEQAAGAAATGWTKESTDLNFEMYIVLDNQNLYIGAEIVDDDPNNGTQAWSGDGFDVFGLLKDLTNAPSRYLADNVANGGEGGFRLSYCINAAYADQLQTLGYQTWQNRTGVEYVGDRAEDRYIVEIKIPFTALAAEFSNEVFAPKDQMWVLLKVDVNDNDGPDDPFGDGRTLQCHWGGVPGNVTSWERGEGWTPVLITKTPLPTAVEDRRPEVPFTTALHANYPNPFNPGTTIKYDLAKAGNVKVVIYDALGREVRTLVDEHQLSGKYSVVWDAKDTAGRPVVSGVYLVKMTAADYVNIGKMLLIK